MFSSQKHIIVIYITAASLLSIVMLWLIGSDSDLPPDKLSGSIRSVTRGASALAPDKDSVARQAHSPDHQADKLASVAGKNGTFSNRFPFETSESSLADDNKLSPEKKIEKYLLLWESRDNSRYLKLWSLILSCDSCLDLMVAQILQPGTSMRLVLEVTHMLIEANQPHINTVVNALLQSGADQETALLFSRQIARSGNPDYMRALLQQIQSVANEGDSIFATSLVQTIESVSDSVVLGPVVELASGLTGAREDIRAAASAVLAKILNRLPDAPVVADRLLALYKEADPAAQEQLWAILTKHSGTMLKFAMQAHNDSNPVLMDAAVEALVEMDHASAVDALMSIQQQLDYPQDYYFDRVSRMVMKSLDASILQRLEHYMSKKEIPVQLKMTAAEGLLSASDSKRAKSILEKMARSERYEDAEIVSYINGRL